MKTLTDRKLITCLLPKKASKAFEVQLLGPDVWPLIKIKAENSKEAIAKYKKQIGVTSSIHEFTCDPI